MGEYAVVVSTVASVLILALGGLGHSLPTSTVRAAAAVSSAAKATGTSPVAARQTFARAPYRTPGVRALYALGWIAGTHDRATCLLATATGASTASQTRDALHRVRDWRGLLRRSHVSETTAVRAIDRGFRSACPLG